MIRRWRDNTFARFGVGFGLGLILATTQEPYNWWWATLGVFPAALWVLGDRASKLFGYALGCGYFFLSLQWIREPFAIEADTFGWMAPFGWGLMAAGLALFWLPLFAFPRREGWRGILLVAATFAACELARGWVFTGFPWGLLAYGFIDTSLAQLALFTGPYLLSTLIPLAAMLIANPWHNRSCFMMGAVLSLVMLGVGATLPPPEYEDNADFRVTLVQANIAQGERHNPDRAQEFLDLQLSLAAGAAPSDLIVLPESAVGFIPDFTPGLGAYMRQTLQNDTPMIFGAIHVVDDNYFNSGYLLEGDNFTWRYDKRHLVPFGEYIPFGALLDRYGLLPTTLTRFSMSAGRDVPDWQAALPRPIVLICYEGIFPRHARADGRLIIQLTNDSWFGRHAGPQQHLAAMRMRAIETGKPVIRATTTGISAIIGADGQIRAEIPLDTRATTTTTIGPHRATTPYLNWGDSATLAFIVAGFWFGWRRRFSITKTGIMT